MGMYGSICQHHPAAGARQTSEGPIQLFRLDASDDLAALPQDEIRLDLDRLFEIQQRVVRILLVEELDQHVVALLPPAAQRGHHLGGEAD